jgi:hypothetical protein
VTVLLLALSRRERTGLAQRNAERISPTRIFHAKHPEDNMTQLAIANEDVAMLETAPTYYVEGHGIRFAYRRLGPATGTPLSECAS